nr:uncharacterized mitochondrial protein AtMg00810-like [Tanacetum cinerariifolium]
YLKGAPSLDLWYLKCLGFDLNGYSDSDYARCNMDKKSTSGLKGAGIARVSGGGVMGVVGSGVMAEKWWEVELQ